VGPIAPVVSGGVGANRPPGRPGLLNPPAIFTAAPMGARRGLKGRRPPVFFSASSRSRSAAALAATSASLNGSGPCTIAAFAAGLNVPSAFSLGSAFLRTGAGNALLSCALAAGNAARESTIAAPETAKLRVVLRAINSHNAIMLGKAITTSLRLSRN
jgi:hypothetical protein